MYAKIVRSIMFGLVASVTLLAADVPAADRGTVTHLLVEGSAYTFVLKQRKGNPTTAWGYMVKHDKNGGEEWSSLLGQSVRVDSAKAVVDSQGDSYIYAVGSYERGDYHKDPFQVGMFIAKLDMDGNVAWIKRMEQTLKYTEDGGSLVGVAYDASRDAVYVMGHTFGAIARQKNIGAKDAVVARYSSDGDLVWSKQFGSAGYEFVNGGAIDSAGNVYVIGGTEGNIDSGGKTPRMFLAKFDSDGNTVALKNRHGVLTTKIREYDELLPSVTGYSAGLKIVDDVLYVVDEVHNRDAGIFSQESFGEEDLGLLVLDTEGVVSRKVRIGTFMSDRIQATHTGNDSFTVDSCGNVYVLSNASHRRKPPNNPSFHHEILVHLVEHGETKATVIRRLDYGEYARAMAIDIGEDGALWLAGTVYASSGRHPFVVTARAKCSRP